MILMKRYRTRSGQSSLWTCVRTSGFIETVNTPECKSFDLLQTTLVLLAFRSPSHAIDVR